MADDVQVKFLKHTEVYNEGEVASFRADKAARLLASGSAERYDGKASVAAYGKPKVESTKVEPK